MRDQLKDAGYFEARITKLKKDIATYEQLLSETVKEKGADFEGAKNGRLILVDGYLNLIDCEYSYGSDISELRNHYDSLLQIYSDGYADFEQQSYTKLIKIVSLGVLLNAASSQFSELELKLSPKDRADYFLNFLLHGIDASWTGSFDSFSYPGIYEPLKEIIEQQKPEQLVRYDKSIWYKSHDGEAWYNSHKSKRNTYCGYWDYEGAAVAKLLEMRSEAFQKAKYLPLDLIQ